MIMNVGNFFTNLIHIFKSDLVRVIGYGHLFGVRNGSYDCEKNKIKNILVLGTSYIVIIVIIIVTIIIILKKK